MSRPSAAQATAYKTLYSFKGSPDGADPKGALVIGKFGELYGTTFAGGTSVHGTVFVLTKGTGEPWKETVLHGFSGSDGQYPQSALVFGAGPGGSGTIFELAPPFHFRKRVDGDSPVRFHPQPQRSERSSSRAAPHRSRRNPIHHDGGWPRRTAGFRLGLVVALVPPATPGGAWTENELWYSFSLNFRAVATPARAC